jgi:hypothetical protein
MKVVLFIIGLALAATGGVIAYRAYFLEPRAAALITNESIRELPNMTRVAGGIIMLIIGAGLAFFAARRRA